MRPRPFTPLDLRPETTPWLETLALARHVKSLGSKCLGISRSGSCWTFESLQHLMPFEINCFFKVTLSIKRSGFQTCTMVDVYNAMIHDAS